MSVKKSKYKEGDLVWLGDPDNEDTLPLVKAVKAKIIAVDLHHEVAITEILPEFRDNDDPDGLCEIALDDILPELSAELQEIRYATTPKEGDRITSIEEDNMMVKLCRQHNADHFGHHCDVYGNFINCGCGFHAHLANGRSYMIQHNADYTVCQRLFPEAAGSRSKNGDIGW